MSQWAKTSVGGATRSNFSRTRSTSEGNVEGVCIRGIVYTVRFVAPAPPSDRVWPFRRFRVRDTSMQPALRPGDRLIIWTWARPRTHDVVVLRDPESRSTLTVKRVAAFTPDGALIVRGDNPNVSRDSRHFGPVPRALVVGRAVYRYLPGPRRGSL
ncbi:MAG: S26 family signal peptidase [Chloroflexi bacterium]|nr:S26 family signal peptidase [Chloroflexota bacterium]